MKITKEQKEFFNQGFIKYNNIELIEVTEERTVLKTIINENSLNPYGIVHGGLLFGIADTAMGVAVRNTGRKALTMNASINFMKQGKGNTITAHARITKNGKNICYVEASLYDEEDKLIANMNSTYYYID